MMITATEAQNNFGKYLKLCRKESIIITRNGKREAMLINAVPAETDAVNELFPVYGISPRKNPDWVTYSRFMEICEKSEGRFELIDGDVYELASPAFSHQKALGILYNKFSEYFSTSGGCDVFFAPLDIFLVRELNRDEEDILEFYTNVVQPDLMVLCDYQDEIEEDKFKGTPTLAVEILSPSTRKKDTWNKLHLYSESGIREYWIIDPKNRKLLIYFFPEDENSPSAVYRDDQVAESVLYEDLSLPLEKLF